MALLVQHHTIVTILAHCLVLLILIYLHGVELYLVLDLILHVAEIVLTQKWEQGVLIADFALVVDFFWFHQEAGYQFGSVVWIVVVVHFCVFGLQPFWFEIIGGGVGRVVWAVGATCLGGIAFFDAEVILIVIIITSSFSSAAVDILQSQVQPICVWCRFGTLKLFFKYFIIIVIVIHVLVLSREHHGVLDVPTFGSSERQAIICCQSTFHLVIYNNRFW